MTTQSQLYADTNNTVSGDIVQGYSLYSWRRKKNAVGVKFTQTTDEATLLRHGVKPVQMLEYPEGGAITDSQIVIQDGIPIQTGTVKTAEDIQTEAEAADLLRRQEEAAELYPEIEESLSGILQIMIIYRDNYDIPIPVNEIAGGISIQRLTELYYSTEPGKAELWQQMHIIYTNNIVGYHFDGSGRRAADLMPILFGMMYTNYIANQ